MQLNVIPELSDWSNSTKRRNLKLYNVYRLILAIALLFSQLIAYRDVPQQAPSLIIKILLVYLLFSIISAAISWSERTSLDIGLPIQTIIDIGFIILMMHLFNQNQSTVGLLLIISIVFASLISEGRYALLYASIASIGILLEQTYSNFIHSTTSENYSNAVLLALSCFATAWLAHTLAERMLKSERLASERGLDIENLAKVNALITQEMPNGVLVVNQLGHIKHLNQQFIQLTGLSEALLNDAIENNRALASLIPELSQLHQDWIISNNLAKHDEATKLTLSNRDLGIRFLSTSSQRANGAIIFVEDWSQIQTQAHQVKLAALGRLTANIAHEIRNPLSAISHANQLLQEDNSDAGTSRMLQIIADNVQRLDQIIKDILELNRRDRTNQESIHLNAFITDFYHQFCAVEKIDTSVFALNLTNETIEIFFDKRHINQILWNLCKNGYRHSKKGAASLSLKIQMNQNKQFIDINVIDDGDGIAPSIQSNLFEPFITTEKTGTGLGLYIARELAEANGAKLNFETSNTGTRFILRVKKV